MILRIPIWNQPEIDEIFDDEPYWLIPIEGFPHVFIEGAPLPNKGDAPFDTEGRRRSIGGVFVDDSIPYNKDGTVDARKVSMDARRASVDAKNAAELRKNSSGYANKGFDNTHI